jgi:hypothetical protein
MPGLVPGIHVFSATSKKYVDGRDKPGHDENRFMFKQLETPESFLAFSVRLSG